MRVAPDVAAYRCERCGRFEHGDSPVWRCPACGGPLDWPGPGILRPSDIADGEASLWRYAAVLPVPRSDAVSLGETVTPLITGAISGTAVRFKLDSLLPTGSFKDRGAAMLMAGLARLGVRNVVEDSSGNAAAAIAAYAARAGIGCTIYVPAAVSTGKLVQTRAYGAHVVAVDGDRDAVAAAAQAAAGGGRAVYASHIWHPLFLAGVKTWALEVWEQLGGRAPDSIVVPVGSGSLLLGAFRAFSELLAGGAIPPLPRLFAAQAAACAPVERAFGRGDDAVAPVPRGPTIAEGVVITQPVRGRRILQAVRGTRGGAVAVSEAAIVAALWELARQGVYVEPTAAVAAAGCAQLLATGQIAPGELTVVLLSGNGLKATETISSQLPAVSRQG